jgi:hypothetical protein
MSFSYSVTHLVEHSNIKIDPDNQSEPTTSVAAEAARSATTGGRVTTHLPRVATVIPASCATSKPPRAPSCEKLSPVAVAPASRPGDRCSGGSSAGATPAWWTAWCKILDRMSWPSPAPQCTPLGCPRLPHGLPPFCAIAKIHAHEIIIYACALRTTWVLAQVSGSCVSATFLRRPCMDRLLQ